MEFGRFEQIDRLEALGWYIDEECQQLQQPGLCGGPTWMKNPNGVIHAVTGGQEFPRTP